MRAGALLAAAVLLAPIVARAQEVKPARDPVAAEALFRAGRELVTAGREAEGCPKFEASFALDPSASTLLNIAKCHEHDGKIATAWEEYAQASVLAREIQAAERQRALEGVAKKGMATLEPRLPKLRIAIVQRPDGLVVKRDGKTLPLSALGEALPADPGAHEVSAAAPGYQVETRAVTLEESKISTLEITLVPEAKAPPPPPASPSVPAWAWATGAGGLVLAGVGVYFLADDLSAIHALRTNCQSNAKGTFCAAGYDVGRDNARKDRDLPLFVGLGGAGVVAIGAAVVGIVRSRTAGAPPAATTGVQAQPWFSATGVGASISGAF